MRFRKAAKSKLFLGGPRPGVSRDGDETIASIHQKTERFINAMWKFNSKARAEEWDMIRRIQKFHVCPYYPIESAEEVVGSELQGDQLGLQAQWYANTLMLDSTTPGTIGPANLPNYLFIGHDHDGGKADIAGLDGRNWKLINTGGWTRDWDEKTLHQHVVIWNENANEPSVHCVWSCRSRTTYTDVP